MSFSLAYNKTTIEESVLDTLRLCFGKSTDSGVVDRP